MHGVKAMVHEQDILIFLEENLSKKRYRHSVNVCRTAESLALHYGCDPEKAVLAGLLHDCARELTKPELVQFAVKAGLGAAEAAAEPKELLHGPAAVYLCRSLFNLNDGDILAAIRYHTTGRENMSLLEKIIFLADFIEPERDFPGVAKLRRLAFRDLRRALIAACDTTIRYILLKGMPIHTDTVLARNYLIREGAGNTQS